ncbi:MAG TPA: antibiotic biosynthesis monooxygenase [Cyanobacteria bacterium UBA11149]|nr:antibiotic biosynthesis monooxygenase [Cyanobacteria bacterium UBA11367]HBE60019.1 antibiotic biosynthesis monooxygenase [Cyanobacteria bacterium UBA11366]HBK63412.1 antibiotic biosynthesis monooxygenase [Cyanobacteria bacterium UBA11166]HBR74607.1 antibiotic biosynthesis monooxygenase [Cyanobacteria bacterium UBA11159]HBS72093.1 antibiotic biosynthesis monooxygenase [Cyanobacteria bacterium UBA11153]HBW90242.1 antibiotic biosynthesis monooxygenase [Cyanobacteria bacterium UBA11149]HCA9614
MSNPTIRVVARIVALPEKVEQVKAILTGLIEPTKTEAGCIQYELLQNQADATDFTFVEEWRSGAELDAHLGNTHIQFAIEKLDGLLGAAPDICRYDKIG